MMSESSSDKKKEAGIKNAEDLSTLNKSELIDQIQNQKTIIEKLEMKINNCKYLNYFHSFLIMF